jgi:4-coumarate--CoA ligase
MLPDIQAVRDCGKERPKLLILIIIERNKMHIYKEKDIFIPRDLNLTELLFQSAGDIPIPESHLIATDNLTNRRLTLGELRDRAGRIAKGLHKSLSPKLGDRWAVILPNCVEYIELSHALLWTGGVACPINHALKGTEIAHALKISRPKFVFAFSESLGAIVQGIDVARKELVKQSIEWETPTVITVINRAEGYSHAPDDYLADERLPIPHYNHTSHHLASIHLSSGTTGQPKGIRLTHHNFVSNCYQLYAHDAAQFHTAARIIAYTPFVHIAMTTMPLFLGPWTGMLHHAMPQFSLEAFGPLVSTVRPTHFQGVPSVTLAFANSDITQRYDFSSAQVINYGGVPLKKATSDLLKSRAPWKIIQLYGMTEGSPYIAYQRLAEELQPGEVGHLLPNIEAVLRKEKTNEDAPIGGPGELWLRGPNISSGYTDKEKSSEAFGEGGWYNTGDVCTISAAGILSVVGRTKELIKYKGFQVSPSELEANLNSHEDVMEAGVGSVWDEEQLTELPTAYVVLRAGLAGDAARHRLRDIHAKTDQMVSGYKKLRGGVWSVSGLPKNPTGKFIRKDFSLFKTGWCSQDQVDLKPRL